MKIKLLILIACTITAFQTARCQPFVYIPDSNLRVILSQLDSVLIIGDSMNLSSPAITSTTHLDLYMSNVHNTTGIEYFTNVDTILAQSSQINYMPAYPPNLKALWIGVSQLDSVYGPLPATLEHLDVSYNHSIKYLPSLPAGLVFLDFSNDSILSLPPLPVTLSILDAGQNQLDSLPSLPPALITMYVGNNHIPSIPALPPLLEVLSANNNPITSLPTLPPHVRSLGVHGTNITCLPILPSGLNFLDIGNTAITCLPNHPPAITSALPNCNSITSSCLAYPEITGITFRDDNGDGIFDSTESPLPNVRMFLMPDSLAFSSDNSGYFSVFVDTGGPYTIMPLPLPYHTITTSPFPSAQFSAYSQVDSLNHIGFSPMLNVNDLVVHVVSTVRPRPGFNHSYKVNYRNTGTTSISTTQLTVIKNPMDSLVSSSDTTYTLNGDSLVWLPGIMNPGQSGSITLTFRLSQSAASGDTLCLSASLEPIAGDTTPGDNVFSLCQRVVNSIDPNDKSVEPFGDLTQAQGIAGEFLYYTIRFQNTGSAEAIFIELRDTLSALLDYTTFEMLDYCHRNSWTLNKINGALKVNFNNIMLPDSTADEPNSHGFIKYRVKSQPGLTPGNLILNTAAIYFDFNSPVLTNTTSTEVISPVSTHETPYLNTVSVYPNPMETYVYIETANMPSGKAELIITDITGRLVQKTHCTGTKTLLQRNQMKAGMYFIEIRLNGTTQAQRKLLVQ